MLREKKLSFDLTVRCYDTLVEKISVTPANINDGRFGPDALPDDPGEIFADSAYRGSYFADAVRARIEKIFGTWKRCYDLGRMRWRGLAKAAVQIHLPAIAYNLKRSLKYPLCTNRVGPQRYDHCSEPTSSANSKNYAT